MSLPRIIVFALGLSGLVLVSSCTGTPTIHPAGSLGMALKGDSLAPPHPTTSDYIDKPALVHPEGPLKWQARF